MLARNFSPTIPWASLAGGVFLAMYISTANFMIAYARIKWVIPLQALCIFYIIAAIPHFFYEYPIVAFIPIVAGAISLWITMSDQFRLFLYHRVKLGEWRRDQLEKNKVRREVIREQKAEAKARKQKYKK